MPDPTPTGPISVAIDGLMTLIANLPFFQTWTGSGSAAMALMHVFAGDVGVAISSISTVSHVTTITTRRPHNILSGAVVTIEGAEVGPQGLGMAVNQVIDMGVTATTLIFTSTLPDGVVKPRFAFVMGVARPIAVVSETESDGLKSAVVGTGGASVLAGSIDILLEADVTAAYVNDQTFAPMEMRNSVGTFHQQLVQTSGTGDFIVLNGVEMVSAEFTSADEQDDGTRRFERWRALLRTRWGLDS